MQVGKKIHNYMQASIDADEKFGHYTASGMPYNLFSLTRSSGQSILLKPGSKWFAFLNKRSQRERDKHCGNEVGTLRRDIEI